MIEVLDRDPDLAQGLRGQRRVSAQRECKAPEATVGCGSWDAQGFANPDPGGFGLLMLSGFLVRRVGRGGRFGSELVGPGDLLRPWQTLGEHLSISFEPTWNAITDIELAVLGDSFARRAAPYPEVATQLVERAMVRSRYLAINMAIVHLPRVEARLHTLFWHFADRWGRVGPSGVLLDIPLTHVLLADLVAARRPTVTTALVALVRSRKLDHTPEGWLLHGSPPREFAKPDGISADGSAPLVTTAAPADGRRAQSRPTRHPRSRRH